MEKTGKLAGNIVWQIAGLILFLATIFLIGYAISKGWKKGQESSYCIDGNKNCYQY